MQKAIIFLILLLLVVPQPAAALMVEEAVPVIIEVEGDPHDFKKQIEMYHPFLEVVQVYDTLFSGVAVKGKPHQLAKVETVSGFKQTYPARLYQATADSVSFLKKNLYQNESKTMYTGEGVKVGVIDTGVDHKHPDLTANFKGGYDLVDLDEDPMETLEGEGEPTLHGTHVAGIIAADGEMKGVAPEAELYAYRALGPGGMGTTVQVLAAMEKAVKDGMDIINMSLGNSVNGPDWPTSVAVNRAAELGVAVVIANGNSGPENWTVGSPATSVKAISVGASTPPLTTPILYDSFSEKQIPLTLLLGSVPWQLAKDYPVIDGGIGDKSIQNAKGKIVMFERGEVPFADKARMAEQAGAAAVLIYNNEAGDFHGSVTDGKQAIQIPVAAISKTDGEWLQKNMVKKSGWIDTVYQTNQDHVTSFSSRGPVTVNWDIKPEIVAPGAAIVSTVPGGYMELQGTSMAAPHVAGGLALIKQAHPDWDQAKLKGALLTTALPLKDETGKLYDPIVQGMGRMQIEKAIDTPAIIYQPLLTFGKVMSRKETHTYQLEIENISSKPQTYQFDMPKQQRGLRWNLPAALELAPGERKTMPIELTADTTLLKTGIHQGWLTLRQEEQTYQLPYLFLIKDADYPKAMGLEFAFKAFSEDEYEYRMYLPEGAERVTVDLYDPATLEFDRTLIELEDQKKGVLEGTLPKRKIGGAGRYLANVTIETDQKKVYYYQTELLIE